MFKLAHISDIHLGPMPHLTFRELASKRITGYVNWHRNRAKHMVSGTLEALVNDIHAKAPDHLTVTGDLVNLASGLEINKAAEWLRTVGPPATTSVVPGNHDAYVPGAHERQCMPGMTMCGATRTRTSGARISSSGRPFAAGDRSG